MTARRLSLALLGTGVGLTALVPLVGVIAMVTAAVGLAITLERDLPAPAERDHPPAAIGS
jgi:hypothetical protein